MPTERRREIDDKGLKTLPHVFWDAFPGNQPEKYAQLKRMGLSFEGKTYSDVWSFLVSENRVEKLVLIMRQEVEGRLLPDNLIELRDLFWEDQTPTWDRMKKLDPYGHQSWVETEVQADGNRWQTKVTGWSPFANFYFQYVD
jgi:hypothetical protein